MASEPTVEDLTTFMDFTAADRQLAVKFLKRYNNVDAATNAYWENDGRLPNENSTWTQNDWDERQFHGDRMYGPENNPTTSFQVHAQDTTESLRPGVFSNAQSRPPSRAENKINTEEDEQMQQAISMSMSQTLEDQETGVTDGKNFKPAERSYYDPNSWSVTISKPVMPNPDPEHRKRPQGAPAFMKPSPRGHYLPALFTIFQEIPMAKDALLVRDAILQDYGVGNDWWDGEPIQIHRVVLSGTEDPRTQDVPLVVESQRIMAFLELTERAYGNVSVLGEISEASPEELGNNAVEGDFLEAWESQVLQVLPDYQLSQIFKIRAKSVDTTEPDLEPNDESFSVIKLNALPVGQPETAHIPKGCLSLYDAIDSALWGAEPVERRTTFIEANQIITFVIDQNTPSQLGVTEPVNAAAVFYMDRYLEENVPKAKDMLRKRQKLLDHVSDADSAQATFQWAPNARNTNQIIDAKDLLNVVKPFFAGTQPTSDEDTADDIINGENYHDLDSHKDVGKTLQEVADRVMTKFQVLEEKKEKLAKQIRELSNFYKEWSDNKEDSPTHRYSLRGVATDPMTTFVLADPNSPEDLIDTLIDDWQWWKICYDAGESEPISIERSDEDRVLATVKNPESKKVMLVYSSDEAIVYGRQPLPSQLRNFVRADNLAFAAELESSAQRPYIGSSAKRKVDDGWDGWDNKPQPSWGGGDSPDSLMAQADDDQLAPLVYGGDENEPPVYSLYPDGKPPPVPPRNSATYLRPTPAIPEHKGSTSGHIEDVKAERAVRGDEDFKDIDLLGVSDEGEMREMNAKRPAPVFGTGGAREEANGEYARSIRMKDMEDLGSLGGEGEGEGEGEGDRDLMQL